MNYKKIYNSLITKAQKRTVLEGCKEKHHIIPKCMGGTNNSFNLAHMTAREHYISHWLLHKIYPYNKKLIYALNRMLRGRNGLIVSSREFEKIKILFQENNPAKEKEAREKISKSKRGSKNPQWRKKGILNGFGGKTHTLEQRQKWSKERKNKIISKEQRTKESILFTGGGNPRAIKVKINDVIYECKKNAYEELGISKSELNKKLKSPTFPNYKYI
jgi:hypothetical protein